jgi:hypothetical protein
VRSGAIAVVCSLLAWPSGLQADESNRTLGLFPTKDHLGESIKHFKHHYKAASCVRDPQNAGDSKDLKTTWLLRVRCGVDRGPTVKGFKLLSAVNPQFPFGLSAIFTKKKLVELNCVLAIDSIEPLLPGLEQEYGRPQNVVYDEKGKIVSLAWRDSQFNLTTEIVPVRAIGKNGLIAFTPKLQVQAVELHLWYTGDESEPDL